MPSPFKTERNNFAADSTEELSGGSSVESAAKLFLSVLNGEGTVAQNNAVVVNAAVAIQCVFPQKSFSDCLEEANESLKCKNALNAYKSLIAN